MAFRVAYLVSRFPKVSETFIVDEIDALERAGVEVELFSFIRSHESVVQSASKPLEARAHFAAMGSVGWFGAIGYWLIRRPFAFLSALFIVAMQHVASPRAFVRAVAATADAASFARDMEDLGVKHVHAHWATHTATSAWVVHRLTGLSYSFTAHADDIFVRRPMLERKVLDASFVVTISQFTRKYLADQVDATAAAHIGVVHCGLDLSHFESTPLPEGQRLEIACVARLEPKKGLIHLLEACAALRDRGVDFRCRVIGEGRERDRLEAKIAELALDPHVFLLGACPREQVHALLAESHVAALPAIVDPEGRADGIPVALIEAAALGRPCVATPVSGIPELVEDEVTGLMVEAGDPASLAAALTRLNDDRDLATRLGRGGRDRVHAEFDIDRSAERLRSLMTAAIDTTHSKSHAATVSAARVAARKGAS